MEHFLHANLVASQGEAGTQDVMFLFYKKMSCVPACERIKPFSAFRCVLRRAWRFVPSTRLLWAPSESASTEILDGLVSGFGNGFVNVIDKHLPAIEKPI